MSATALEKEFTPQALTSLTEEEELFRASVREPSPAFERTRSSVFSGRSPGGGAFAAINVP